MNVYVRNTGNGYPVVGLEHAKILAGDWRNFSAKQRMYDNGGTHHFAILVEAENVEKLTNIGFNVRHYQPKNRPEDPGYSYLDINFGWQLRDPNIFVISDGVSTHQTEESVGDLDMLNNIDYADIEVSPRHWTNNGRSGVKPWVSEMYVYLQEPSPIYRNYQNRIQTSMEPVQPEIPFTPSEEDDIPF